MRATLLLAALLACLTPSLAQLSTDPRRDTKVWRSSLKKVRLLRKRDQESSAAPQ